MLVTINISNMNSKMIKNLFDIRPVYSVVKRKLSQNDQPPDLFKFYREDVDHFSDKYRPLNAQDYSRFISSRAAKREPALTRQITNLAYKVGKQMISLAEGMPNESVFPFSRLVVEMKRGGGFQLEGAQLAASMQYVPSQGLPALLDSLRSLQQSLHRPPPLALPRDVMATNGSQHGIYQCFELLMEPGDPIILTEFAYTGALTALKPFDPELITIPEDSNGMNPEPLEAILSERLARGVRMPRVLYIIPTGNNPTGAVTSAERRRRLYDMACRYDFLIVEDEPYMFLNYDDSPIPSFLSLDWCGRVVRLDSLSKVVSAGLRAGWVTAPAPLMQRLELMMQVQILHSCTLSQVILNRLLEDRAALFAHVIAARAFYRRRRDALQAALRHVAGVAEWTAPRAGLFLWLKVQGVQDVHHMVFHTAFERGLMLIPGQAFIYDTRAPCQHIRLTFSKIPEEKMDAAARLLADVIKNEQAAGSRARVATEQ